MIEILIKYLPDKDCYGVYEPTTDTLLVSSSISESLVSLSIKGKVSARPSQRYLSKVSAFSLS